MVEKVTLQAWQVRLNRFVFHTLSVVVEISLWLLSFRQVPFNNLVTFNL